MTDHSTTDPSSRPSTPPVATTIRVHGIGGSSPQQLLDDPDVRLLVGDEESGFWRPRSRPHEPGAPEIEREGLAWGGRTSGSWRSAFWVLLLPFALVNIASFSHAPGEMPGRRLRLFAASLTASAVLATAVIWFDAVAVQCGGQATCLEGRALLRPLATMGDGTLFVGHPERRLAFMTLFPLAVLLVLWFAGRVGTRGVDGADHEGELGPHLRRLGLDDADFWHGAATAERQRSLHLAVGRLTLTATLASCLYPLFAQAPFLQGVVGVVGVVTLLLLLLAFRLSLVDAMHARERHPPAPRWVAMLGLGRPDALSVVTTLLRGGSWVALAVLVGVGTNGAVPQWALTLLLVLGIVALVVVVPEPRGHAGLRSGLAEQRLRRVIGIVALLLGTLAAVVARVDPAVVAEPTFRASGGFAGLYVPAYSVSIAIGAFQLLLLIGLVVRPSTAPRAVWARDGEDGAPRAGERDPARDGGDDHPFAGRMPFAMAMLALFMTTSFGAGAHLAVADWIGDVSRPWQLGVADAPPPDGIAAIALPWWYEATAIILVLVGLGLLVLGAVAWLRLNRFADEVVDAAPVLVVPDTTPGALPLPPVRTSRARLLRAVVTHLRSRRQIGRLPEQDTVPGTPDDDRLAAIAFQWRLHGLLLRVDRWLVRGLVVLGLAAIVLTVVQSPDLWDGPCPDGCGGWVGKLFGRSSGAVGRAALALTAALPLAAVAALRSLTRDQARRRQVAGVLWDVATFWPRHGHPFAPPAYGERVVPQLRLHVDRLRAEGRQVVVAGHSQGSVIAAAAMALPGAEVGEDGPLPRLVTYGSPLGLIYERLFPAYFAGPFHRSVLAATDGWTNLLTLTDVFAYPLFDIEVRGDETLGDVVSGWGGRPVSSDHGDVVLVDPLLFANPWEEQPPPRIGGHSAYHQHPAVSEVLVAMVHRQQAARPTAVTADA